MVRFVATAIVALSLGAVSGVIAVYSLLGPRLDRMTAERDKLAGDLARSQGESALAAERSAHAEAELTGLRTQVAALNDLVASLRQRQAADTAAVVENLAEVNYTEESAPVADAASISTDGQRPAERRRSGSWGDLTPEQREAYLAQRRERVAEMRENVQRFMDREFDRASDAETKERIAALAEYTEYSMDLMRALREAESDEEREAIREELGTAREALRDLTLDQQDHMLRQLAADQGITQSDKQDAFIEATRRTLSSPFFTGPATVMSRRGFRGGGGWRRPQPAAPPANP